MPWLRLVGQLYRQTVRSPVMLKIAEPGKPDQSGTYAHYANDFTFCFVRNSFSPRSAAFSSLAALIGSLALGLLLRFLARPLGPLLSLRFWDSSARSIAPLLLPEQDECFVRLLRAVAIGMQYEEERVLNWSG